MTSKTYVAIRCLKALPLTIVRQLSAIDTKNWSDHSTSRFLLHIKRPLGVHTKTFEVLLLTGTKDHVVKIGLQRLFKRLCHRTP